MEEYIGEEEVQSLPSCIHSNSLQSISARVAQITSHIPHSRPNAKIKTNTIMGSRGTSKGLVLLTGGTGFIGFRTLVETLQTGYHVRAAIRRESSIAEIQAARSIQPYLSALTFVIVPDITVPGAFDEAVKDVDYIIHLASPLAIPSDDHEKTIIQPAIKGTVGILYSALKVPTLKRVVITASIVSVMPIGAFIDPTFSEIVYPNTSVPDMSGPYGDAFHAYASSKNQAFNASTRFIEENKPSWSVVNVMPAFVMGRSELAIAKGRKAVRSGTNAIGLNPVMGVKNPDGLWALTCHVDDVAYTHVQALNEAKVPKSTNLGVVYRGVEGGIIWDDSLEIVKKHFPKEVESGVFPLGGTQGSKKLRFDATETEKVLGFKFKNWEEQILSVAGAYAEAKA
jgi:nucleoside-diphosphate-sugar epimerase